MKINIVHKDRAVQIPVRFKLPDTAPQVVETPPTPPTPPEPEPEPEQAPHKSRRPKSKKPGKIATFFRQHPKFRIILPCVSGIIFTALLVFAGLKIYQWHQDDLNNRKQQEQAAEDAAGQEVVAEGELVNPPAEQDDDYWYYAKMPFYEVNFDELLAKNSDTVAFIHMNDSYVNYPVVQTTDNDYYLTHAYDHSYNDAGWVFMDYRSVLPSDNTVIYGHGRWNGTVFGTLKNALDPSWQQNKDNYVIWLSTPSENFLYQIFSVYVIPAENYYLKQTFASPDDKMAWLSTMQGRNTAPVSATLVPTDSILTLSTCLDDFDNRVVIHARLIKRQAR